MPINKNAYLRYMTIDTCFSDYHNPICIEDLIEKVNDNLIYENGNDSGIGRTQIYKDIKFMESENGWSVEIEKITRDRKKLYRYKEKGFTIKDKGLTQEESDKLRSALEVLSRFHGMPQFEWIEELIPQIETKMGLVNRSQPAILFESNIDYIGAKFINPIFNSIISQKVLNISYQSFKSDSKEFTFHPQLLKEFNNRWFCLGKNDHEQYEIQVLALDRIKNISETSKEYIQLDIDWIEYFDEMIGVSRKENQKPELIKFWVSKEQVPYIKTKPLHGTQRFIEDNNDGKIFSIEVIRNKELEMLFNSYGSEIKII